MPEKKKSSRLRWILLSVATLVIVVAAMAILPEKSVRTELVIEATPSEIWAVLTDGSGYPEWNPVFTAVQGEHREGATVEYTMVLPGSDPTQVKVTVVRAEEGRELNQFGGTRGILTFDHHWTLEPVDGGTRVVQHEYYRGIGVLFWDTSSMGPTYDRANAALRDRVLSLR